MSLQYISFQQNRIQRGPPLGLSSYSLYPNSLCNNNSQSTLPQIVVAIFPFKISKALEKFVYLQILTCPPRARYTEILYAFMPFTYIYKVHFAESV